VDGNLLLCDDMKMQLDEQRSSQQIKVKLLAAHNFLALFFTQSIVIAAVATKTHQQQLLFFLLHFS